MLNQLTIKEARERLDSGQITAAALTMACLEKIKQADGQIKACLLVDEVGAVKAAELADRRLAAGQRGGLLGIPYLAKDNILTKGLRTTAGSAMLASYIAPTDATVIVKLKAAGAVLLGKTNLDEFAHGASTEFSAFGPTHNPWDLQRVPGGSSGGSAAAVAANFCLFALGTDTGGSIRHPAGFCGVVGLKPTYGLASRFGLVAMTSSTDVPGPLTKTVEDAALVLAVIAGHDELDRTTVKRAEDDYGRAMNLESIKDLKIGLPKEYFSAGLDKSVVQKIKAAAAQLEKLGAKLVEVSLPSTKYGVSVYYIITPCEISSNLARFDGVRYGHQAEAINLAEHYALSRAEGFGPETKRRIMLGTFALSAGYYDAYYLQAQKVRSLIIADFDNAFSQVDLLLTPTTPHTAFKFGEKAQDPLAMYLEDLFLTPSSLAGLPAISIPAGLIGNLPIGLQLIGPKFSEPLILGVGEKLQIKI